MIVFAEGFYIQCFGRVAPGVEALDLGPTPEGYGKEEKFITFKHDFDSLQKAPRWLDPAKVIDERWVKLMCKQLILHIYNNEVRAELV